MLAEVTRDSGEDMPPEIVVVNKIDRPGARPDWVVDQVFELFDRLGATAEQMDFPIVYAQAKAGKAWPVVSTARTP